MKNVKIAIVGSRDYEDVDFMKTVIKGIVEKFEDFDITIVSGGQSDGADGIAKKLATSTSRLSYEEFPPAHYQWNEYCVKDKSYYDKDFDNSNYHRRK